MNTQPNWAQQAAAKESSGSPNKNLLWAGIGIGVAVIIAIVIAVATTGGSGGSGAKLTVNASASAKVTGEDLPEAPADSAGLFDAATDPAVGKTIPTVEATAMNGEPYTIKPGKPTLLVFAAHWCPHCQKEIPLIVEWTDAGLIPDGVDVVAVSTSVDKTGNNFPPTKWLMRENWDHPAVADTNSSQIAKAFAVGGFPYFVAVDADGKVVQRGSGELTQDQFVSLVNQIKSGGSAAK
jgi:thiol-disulfide isomerase/thioredoxin